MVIKEKSSSGVCVCLRLVATPPPNKLKGLQRERERDSIAR